MSGLTNRLLASRMRFCLAAAACLLLGACANGDFGRIKPSLVRDDTHDWVGVRAASRQAKPASQLPLTDAERQLRDLAYPLIEPPYDRQRWYSVLAEYGLSGEDWPYPDRTAYAVRLMATPVRSHTARYAKLVEDIRNDITRIDPFFAVARYVTDMDHKRKRSFAHLSWPESMDKQGDALDRVGENAAIIAWVRGALRERVASYRLALEQLVIATPSPMAAEAERALNLLQSRLAAHSDVMQVAEAADARLAPGRPFSK